MDIKLMKESLVTNVYHLDLDKKVPLHKHEKQDEIFYCVKGSGFGVLEESEIELTVGKEFIVKAGVMHSLRTDGNLYVCSFLIPIVED
jgi:mannose-6-phosphate isomerase-like protein (cupin superfamily)